MFVILYSIRLRLVLVNVIFLCLAECIYKQIMIISSRVAPVVGGAARQGWIPSLVRRLVGGQQRSKRESASALTCCSCSPG